MLSVVGGARRKGKRSPEQRNREEGVVKGTRGEQGGMSGRKEVCSNKIEKRRKTMEIYATALPRKHGRGEEGSE